MMKNNRFNVFEISVNKKQEEKINEARLTKDFIDDCLKVAEKLKKKSNNK